MMVCIDAKWRSLLVSLSCLRTDDSGEDDAFFDVGVGDEPYLIADRRRVWSGRMSVNDEADLTGVEPIAFEEYIRVELWDRDAGPQAGQDDRLGDIDISAVYAGLGELSHQFKTRRARYTLVYKVE